MAHCLVRQGQSRGDLGIRQAISEQAKQPDLPRGEPARVGTACRPGAEGHWQAAGLPVAVVGAAYRCGAWDRSAVDTFNCSTDLALDGRRAQPVQRLTPN